MIGAGLCQQNFLNFNYSLITLLVIYYSLYFFLVKIINWQFLSTFTKNTTTKINYDSITTSDGRFWPEIQDILLL